MPCELNRDAKIRLWEEDLAWLMQQPRTLERDHIADVLKWQIRHLTATEIQLVINELDNAERL